MKKTVYSICLLVVVGVLIAILGLGRRARVEPEIETLLKKAVLLIADVGTVINKDGAIDTGCLQEYENNLSEIFKDDSKEAQKYLETKRQVYESFNNHSDAVLENAITDFDVRTYDEKGDAAKVVFDYTLIQKYIPYFKKKGLYVASMSAGKETVECELEKQEDGNWKIVQTKSVHYESGTLEQMNITDTDYTKLFKTRQEACDYLNKIDVISFR